MSEVYDVFLSHNSLDKETVELIARQLHEKVGLRPFLDKWHLIPGEPWQEAIEQALDESMTCAVFLGPNGLGSWENEEMRSALEARARNESFRVIPVLLPGAPLPERGTLPRFLSRLTWVDFRNGLDDPEALHLLECGVRGIAPGPSPIAASHSNGHSPYRGLQKFRPEDSEWFFGRESETQQLVERLKTTRFLAVTGASGSGKSSVVLAGLVPALKEGALPDSAEWRFLIFTPTEQPLEELAVHLAELVPDLSVVALLKELENDKRALHLFVRQMLRNASVGCYVVVIVDQFEEVFAQCHDEHKRESFFSSLLYASSVSGGRTIVVPTIRADFIARCGAYPQWADRLSTSQFFVTPMIENQLYDAILRPAARAGLEFESGLADVICSEVMDQPGGLPLMQHALFELWKRRQGHTLTFAAYREISGVAGALARTADALYESLSEVQQAVARRVLLELVQPGEGIEVTRRRAKLSDLLAHDDQADQVDAVLHRLADERLVTIDQERETEQLVVNVAHEALIHNWPVLQSWIAEDRESLRIQRLLQDSAREWNDTGRDHGLLFRGVRLAQAMEWVRGHEDHITPLQNEFLEASALGHKYTNH